MTRSGHCRGDAACAVRVSDCQTSINRHVTLDCRYHTLFPSTSRLCNHDLLLIPMETFEGNRDPTLCVEDVSLDAVPVHQRFDEVDSKLEVSAKDVVVVVRNHP